MIQSVIRRYAPKWLMDDCYQAACVGLVKALKNKENVKNFGPYAYTSMKNEVLEEVARNAGIGNGVFALDKQTLLLYGEFKKRRNNGTLHEMKITEPMLKRFEGFLNSKRYSSSEMERRPSDTLLDKLEIY